MGKLKVDLKQEFHVIIVPKNVLSSRILLNNLKIKIYKTIILPVLCNMVS